MVRVADTGNKGEVSHGGVIMGDAIRIWRLLGEVGREMVTVQVGKALPLLGNQGGGLGWGWRSERLGEVPAAEATKEGGGAKLERQDFAGAIHHLPKPGEHLLVRLRHEEQGGCEAVFELLDLRQAGAEVVDTIDDVRIASEGFGPCFGVVWAEASKDVGAFEVIAGSKVVRKGFVPGIGESERWKHGRFRMVAGLVGGGSDGDLSGDRRGGFGDARRSRLRARRRNEVRGDLTGSG